METALYGKHGPLVTVEEFVRRAGPNYKDKGIFPYCPCCCEVLEIYGLHSPNVTSRFDHKNRDPNANPLDDCLLSNRSDQRFDGLEPSSFDQIRAAELRKQFFRDEFVKKAYTFCHHFCAPKSFPSSKWRDVIQRADRKNIWAYKEIPLWVIPYILLTLENFEATSQSTGETYGFHFLIEKPRGTKAEHLWITPEECFLLRVFSKSGEPMRHRNIPFQFSEKGFEEIGSQNSWISSGLLRSLKAAA